MNLAVPPVVIPAISVRWAGGTGSLCGVCVCVYVQGLGLSTRNGPLPPGHGFVGGGT